MAVFLVVKTLDVNYAPLTGAKVRASFDNTAAVDLTPVGKGDMLEAPVPKGAKNVVVFATLSGFWDVRQKLLVDDTASPPTLKFDGTQAINVRNLDVHSRGTDFNVEVFVVFGHLRDAADLVRDTADLNNIPLNLTPRKIHRFRTPILNPSGTGFGLLNASTKTVTPRQALFFAERITNPKLIAVAHAGFGNPDRIRQKTPMSYHMFFHPFIPGTFSGDYPFGSDYIDLISRYLVQTFDESGANGRPVQGKALAYQNIADLPKVHLVFPVGGKSSQMGDLNTQASALRLIQEVSYWMQRMRGVSFPQQPVGFIALSAFSAGVRFLNAILSSTKQSAFLDKLRHIYLLDAVFADARGRSSPTETASFARLVKAWHNGGQAGRRIRVYSQDILWFNAFISSLSGATLTSGPEGAKEAEASAGTLLHVPLAFWKRIDSTATASGVHQVMPAKFAEHSVTNSKFF